MESGKEELGSSQWYQDKRQQAQSEKHEIPPKYNENLFVVQAGGQSSRLSGEAVKYPALEHCLGTVLGKLFQLVQLCGGLG